MNHLGSCSLAEEHLLAPEFALRTPEASDRPRRVPLTGVQKPGLLMGRMIPSRSSARCRSDAPSLESPPSRHSELVGTSSSHFPFFPVIDGKSLRTLLLPCIFQIIIPLHCISFQAASRMARPLLTKLFCTRHLPSTAARPSPNLQIEGASVSRSSTTITLSV